ncbi:DUF11 domain-containing protein, partial [Arcicella sp. LKC2W]
SQITSLSVGTKSLSFVAKVIGSQSITNKAEISKSDQFDPNSQINTGTEDGQDDTDDAILTPKIADLSVEKLVSKTNPNVGETITYTIKVKNAGPDNATNVQIKDILPTGLQFVSSTGTPAADFSLSSNILLSNNIASITSGGEATLTFQAKVTQSGAILNKAEVSKSDVYDIDSQPNTGTEDGQDDTGGVLIGGQQSDLSLIKSVSTTTGTPAAGMPATPNVGDNVIYTITVNNAGPSSATNVEVLDILPSGLQFVSSTDFTNTNGTLTGAIASITVGNPKVLTFIAKVTGNQSITNKAEISKSDQFDPDSQVGTGTEDGQDDIDDAVLIPQQADLSLLKTVSKTNPSVGENITYTISVTNEGPNVATNVEVKDVLPAGLQFVSSSDLINNAGTLTGTIANIPLGATRSLSFIAKVTQSGSILNRAEVSKSDQFDSDSQPNTGTLDGQDDTGGVLIGGQQSDLSLQKTVNNPTPNVGENVIYTIIVTNAGPSIATNVEVKDVLPAGLQFISSSDFQLSGSTLTSQITSLSVGTKTLSFVAKVIGNQSITNKAEISKSDQFDPDSQINTGTEDSQDDTDDAILTPKIADLSVEKLVSKTNPNVGETIIYTIKVKNAGPDNATNVQVKDILPVGLQFVSSTDFSLSSNILLSNNIASITSGGEATLTFQAKVTQSGAILNKAEVSKSDQYDSDSQVNTGTEDGQDDTGGVLIGGQQADLSLTKSVSSTTGTPAAPNVGDNVIYTITVNNAGPSSATNVEVLDILPAGLQFVSSSDFVNTSGTLTGAIASITVGNPKVLTFIAKVTGNQSITNKAEISKSDQFDPDSQVGTGTEDGQDDTDDAVLIPQQADLSLLKTVSKTNPSVGENITYTISVTNEGPNVATNVEVKDVLPAGLQFISSSDLINNAGTLTGTIANIPLGATRSLSFIAKVTQSGSILNRAEVSKSDQFDSDSQPNTGTLDGQDDTGGVLIGGQQSDLSLTKTVNNPTPNVGENVIYTIVVTNAGPSIATNVEVKDVLPAGLQFVSSSDFQLSGSTLTSQITSLSVGTKTLSFVAKVIGNQSITNKAEISKSDQFDPDSQINTGTEDGQDDTDDAILTPQIADLSVEKLASKTNPNVGETITYTIKVKNAGPDNATNVQVKDILPTGLQFVSSTDFSLSSNTLLSNNIASITSGGEATLTFQAKVTQSGAILNKAEVSKSDQYDSDSQVNTGTEDGQDDTGGVLIGGQQADLSLTKSVSNTTGTPAAPNVGDNVIYTITVNNAGPSTATNIEVLDILPAGLQFVSSSDFVNTSGTLTGQVLNLPVGTPKVLIFIAKVTGNQSITNKAEISKSDQFDPDSQVGTGTEDGQDDTDDAVLIPQIADLSLLKTVSKTNPSVGENITYTISVTNEGPNVATNVEVKDVLPAGLQFISSSDLVNNAGTLTGTIANIPLGATRSLSFVAKVTQSGSILNRAEVSKSDQFDSDSQPNTGTLDGQDDTGGVLIGGQQSDLSLQKTVNNPTPNVGENVIYTIIVTNAGPSIATNVEVKDVLPAGLSFVSSSDFQLSGSTLTSQITSLSVGTKSLSFVAKVIGSQSITNKAEISKSDQFDPDSQINTGTEDGQDDTDDAILTPKIADLSVEKLVSKTNPNVGETITYTIKVKNAGPDNATNVQVKDILPTGLQFVSSTGTPAADFSLSSNILLSNNMGSITSGGEATLTFQAKVTQSGAILNKAEVSKSDVYDIDSQPNTGTEDGQDDTGGVLIGGQQADLSLTKSVSSTTGTPASPNVGDNVIYTITVTNAGPSTATNVEVLDILPAGLQFVSSSDFVNINGTLTGAITSITVGNPKVLTFIAKVTGNQSITNKAEISKSDQFDPDSQVGTGTEDGQDDTDDAVLIPQQADLSLTKTVSNTNPSVNTDVTYTISVTNEGPNVATNVEVKDVLPAGLQFISSSDLINNAGTLTGTIANIPLGATRSLSFIAKVTQSGSILNRAEISKSDQYDSDSQPNTGTLDGQDDTGGVLIGGQQSDLSLQKTVNNPTPNVGENVIYTIVVTNAGPSIATNVEVKDVLPAGLQFVSSSDFQLSGSTLTSQITSLSVGTKSLIFVAKVIGSQSITNKAEISKSDQFDPNSQINTGTEDGQDDTDDAILTPKIADLSVEKLVSKTNPNVGETITYTIKVKNAGPDNATNVQVKDILPVGLQFVSSTDFSLSSNILLSNNIASITSGGEATLTFQAKVTQSGAILNKAEVSKSDVYDIDSQPNTGTEDGQDDTGGVLIGGQQSDLSLTKSVSTTTGTPAAGMPATGTPAAPNVGDNVIYTITVTNAGPSTATNIEVLDILPSGLQFVSSTDFTNTNGTLTGAITSITVGNPKVLTFIAKVTGNQSITNKAEISKSDQFDPDSQVGTGTEDGQDDTDDAVLIPQIADLSLLKTVSKTNPSVGENITYTISVTNEGPNVATNVEVKDVLPAGLQFVSSIDLVNNAGTLTGTIANIPLGATRSLSFVAKVTQSGSILNRAEVSKSDQFDSDSQPNTGTLDGQDDTGGVLIGGQQSDLSLTKTVNNTTPNVGENVIYTIVVTNAGPSIATNVEVKDVLPAGLSFVSSSDFQLSGSTLTSQMSSLSVGIKTLSFVAKVIGNQSITNKAEISKSDQFDPNSQINTGTEDGQDDTDDAILTPKIADLSVEKLVSKTNPNVGETITYTIKVKNAGPDNATNVQVKDILPVGLQFVSSTDFSLSSNTLLSNNIASITSGGEATLTFQAKVTQSGAILNKAEVSKSDQYDSDSQVNTGTEDGQDDTGGVLIGGQQADLSLTKSVSSTTGTPAAGMPATGTPAAPNVGDNVIYTITVTNAGPSTATNVEVLDILPSGLQFVSSTDFTNTNGTLTGAIASITVGNPKVLTFIAKVTGNQSITNKAEVSKSDQFDPDSQVGTGTEDGQDDTDDAVLIPQQADLSLTKTVSNTNPSVNTDVTYTISVTNEGPNVATNVEVK